MFSGKVMIIHLTAALIKNLSLYKMSYILEPFNHSENKKKIRIVTKLGFSNYATKSNFKSATDI